jgi:hypothetical protein
MDIGECGVCSLWASGTRLQSGSRRPNGTTPMDNFVCFHCQEESRQLHEMERSMNECWKRRKNPQAQRRKVA